MIDSLNEAIKHCDEIIADVTICNECRKEHKWLRNRLLELKSYKEGTPKGDSLPMNHHKVIAVDFDGTIVTNEFPKIGKLMEKTVQRMKREREKGSTLIIWTCRGGDHLKDAIRFLRENEIPFDYVNENPLNAYGDDTRKLYANEYWDDNAINVNDL